MAQCNRGGWEGESVVLILFFLTQYCWVSGPPITAALLRVQLTINMRFISYWLATILSPPIGWVFRVWNILNRANFLAHVSHSCNTSRNLKVQIVGILSLQAISIETHSLIITREQMTLTLSIVLSQYFLPYWDVNDESTFSIELYRYFWLDFKFDQIKNIDVNEVFT